MKIRFKTEKIPCSDWTMRHFGSAVEKNIDGYVYHNLNISLENLLVVFNVYKNKDDDFPCMILSNSCINQSIEFLPIDNNTFCIRSGQNGINNFNMLENGVIEGEIIDCQDYFYEIIIL